MVTEQDQLDELILQIFEEQEEQFYFPVTSQNTARNFVKALYTAKNLPYEKFYGEIGEFEHNFSAWRKGLGRIGIGNRVMERINKPLEDILVSDDEEDVNEILNRIRQKDDGSTTRPENDRVPPITSVVNTEETRLIKLKESIRKQDESSTASNDKTLTAASNGKTSSSTNGSSSNSDQPRRELTDSWRSNIESKIKKLEEERTAPDSPKVTRTKLPGAELEQRQPGLVDFRSVLKRRSQHVEGERAPGGGDRRSMPPSIGSLELSGSSGIGSLSGSADTINKIENGSKAKLKDYTLRAKSEPRILPLKAEQGKESSEESSTDSPEENKDKKDLFDEKNDVDKEFADVKEFDSVELHEEKIVTKVMSSETKAAPLAAADDEDLTSTSVSESSSSSDNSSDSGVNEEEASNKDEQDAKHENVEDSEEEKEEDVASENYDSDLDETNEDLIREGKLLAEQVTKYKNKVGNRDGVGYLYAFRDTSSGKVKVGESRTPKKRLEQALCFNINLELVSALPVSLRKLAAQRAQGRLKRYQVSNHDGWFDGPLDDIISTMTSTAERYPKNSSEC